jgi:PhnB protein
VSTDPFDQLRPVDPPAPDRRFVARLRARVHAALTDADLPVIALPERTTTMTDTTTTTATITPYLCVSPAADALVWYRDHLGAVETIRYTADDGRIGHAEVTIEGATVMLSDEYPELDVVSPTTLGGTPTTLHLLVADVDAVHAEVVAGGARVAGPPKDEAYGARSFSMLDPFGHRWMIQTPTGEPTVPEIQEQISDYTITRPDD